MVRVYTSTFTNKVDSKGRVSVPASFRALATEEGFAGIFAYPSLEQPAIDASGQDYFGRLAEAVDDLPPFSAEREAFSTAIFGQSHQLAFDGDGRITLPERLIVAGGLNDSVVFVGLGQFFRLWSPDRFAAEREKAAAFVRGNPGLLRWPSRRKDSP